MSVLSPVSSRGHRGRGRPIIAAVVVTLVVMATACGQKSGVHLASGTAGSSGGSGGLQAGSSGSGGLDQGSSSGSGSSGGSSAGGASGSAGGSISGGSSSSGSGGSGGSTGAAGGTGASGASSASGGGAAGSSAASGPGDHTGVTDNSILIGIHAPLTGAGVPAPQFDLGKDVYFNFINKTGGINGRQVKVVVEDDGYNPSQAVAACKKMVEQDHVFMLFGGGGTDQIVACAQYAATVHVPYEAEGVTEQALGSLPSYFAASMTYPAQSTLLASYIKAVVHQTKVIMVRADTDNFNDAQRAFQAAGASNGLNVQVITVSKDGSDALSVASQMCQAGGVGGSFAVFPLMAPSAFVKLANAAAGQACYPRYAGIGITLGLNVVAQGTCGSQALKNGASFFSPFPGLDKIDAIDPNYNKAYQAQNGTAGDDIGLALWGGDKLLAAQLAAAGRNLTRQSFVAAVAGKHFSTGVYPDVDYAHGRFGGTGVHVLIANCGKQKYDTQFTFKSSFP